jgi:hypothetical protein
MDNTPHVKGWFRAMRSQEALELLKASHPAFVLAYMIAYRGQFSEEFNRHNLKLGEAFLGDYKSYGMSEQEYRTAKAQLAKWNFATFRPTSKGTVAKLTDTRLFAIFRLEPNEQNNNQLTDSQRTANGQLTTTENEKNEEDQKSERRSRPRLFKEEELSVFELDRIVHDPTGPEDFEKYCFEILGKDEMARCGSRWRKRAEDEPDRLKRVLDQMRIEQREGKGIRNTGRYAEDLWKRFN